MALIRALNSSISGLDATSDRMDQIGDNLANSNTPAFKAKRTSFQTILSQTKAFGTAPQGEFGGTNPNQVGLGTQVSEISKNFEQGALKTTGRRSDVAIEGDGFFVTEGTNGEREFTRDGTFGLNRNKVLTDPATGRKVLGLNADLETFSLPTGGTLEPIKIPLGNLKIARQTRNVSFDGNLNFDGDLANSGAQLESTETFLDAGGGAPSLTTDLADLQKVTPTGPVDLGISNGDVIRIKAEKGDRNIPEKTFIVDDEPTQGVDGFGTTVDDFLDFLEGSLGISHSGDNTAVNTDAYSSNILKDTVDSADTFTLGASDTYDTSGRGTPVNWEARGVEVGDYFRVLTGDGAGQNVQISDLVDNSGDGNPDTLVFEGEGLDDTLPLPSADDQFAINSASRVALGTDGGSNNSNLLEDRNVTDGKFAVFSNAGEQNAIQNLRISEKDGDLLTTFNEVEEASGESAIVNTTMFDSRGKPHKVEITYTKVAESNRGTKWRWIAEAEDQVGEIEPAQPGTPDTDSFVDDRVVGTGFINFDPDGSFQKENPKPNISIDLSNTGAESPMVATLNHDNLTALSNFESEVELANQDGFEQGVLNDFSVGNDGTITGQFDNGLTRPIARLQLARFANNNGLNDAGGNAVVPGPNSGDPVIGNPGEFGRGTVRGGAIEESNVDVAEQFTNMIVNQRAFQANSRAIQTSDQMLQEVVNIR